MWELTHKSKSSKTEINELEKQQDYDASYNRSKYITICNHSIGKYVNQSFRVTSNIPINNVWLLLLGDKGQQLSKD